MTEQELEQQIERCRRIARMITDDHVRRSLEQLAEEYAAQLPSPGKDFPSDDFPGGDFPGGNFPGGEHSPRH